MSENSDQGAKPAAQQQAQQSTAVVQWDPGTASEAWQLAKYYQTSQLLPKALANVGDVFVTIAAGRDFGWSPMQSMRGIYVVEGKPSLSADAMVGIAKSSKVCEYFVMKESTVKIATYETKRRGDPSPTTMSFTIEEAAQAGLSGKKGPWTAYPARMLRNRCKSALCKEVYEELFFGTYEESEAEEIPRPGRKPQVSVSATPTIERELNAAPTARAAPAVEHHGSATTEPAHDPKTGEIDGDEEPLATTFIRRIGEAEDVVALTTLGSEIKMAADRGYITHPERAGLMPVYLDRQKALQASRAA